MVATSFPCQPRWGATMALAGAFLWGRAALLPSCYFVSRTVDYTNYGSMSVIGILRQPFADIASWVRLGLRARRKTARSDGSPSPNYSDWYAMNKRTIRIEVGPPGVLL